MLFTSYEFLGFVLILGLLYYILPKKAKWPLLLIASLVFYAFSGVKALIFVGITAFTVYGAGMLIDRNRAAVDAYIKANKDTLSKEEKKAYKAKAARIRTVYLLLCMCLNLGILVALKFEFVSLLQPMGISFYTLRAVGYLVDIHRGSYKAERNPLRFLLFISFFPIVIQGPLSNYGDIAPTLFEGNAFDKKNVSFGLQRMLWGFFKKLVVADRVMKAVMVYIGDPVTYRGAYALMGMLLYTVELYADFTGGIDITIGVSEMLGIKVSENFERPYFSTSLKEYWRRWHITMCEWFKNYVFFPVSVSKPMQKLLKVTRKVFGERVGKRIPVYVSSFIVWLLTGLWHGPTWNFVVWGLLNWLILMVSEEFEPLYEKFHKRFGWTNAAGYKVFMMIRTFILITVLNLFDCFVNVKTTLTSIASVVTAGNYKGALAGAYKAFGLSAADLVILGISIAIMFTVSIVQEKMSGNGQTSGNSKVRERLSALPFPVQACIWTALFAAVLLFGAYGVGYDQSQFIYNKF
jgi:D-alanyl-lipoteichoic acid acyltransferase DltB (MBOAT superfamily)